MSVASRVNLQIIGGIQRRIKSTECGFLGTAWSFVACEDGTAYWINVVTGTTLESTRNEGEDENGKLD